MSFTVCSSYAIVRKAGVSVNSSLAASLAFLAQISDEAEALINATARIDLIANYSSLNSTTRNILGAIASSWGGNQLIMADMSGYTSRYEAQTMLDVNDQTVQTGLKLIEDKNVTDFMD